MDTTETMPEGAEAEYERIVEPVAIIPTAPDAKTTLVTTEVRVADTRPLYQRIRDAAWDVVRAYGDEDLDAPERAIWDLQKLLPPSVRAYALPNGHLAIFFDGEPGSGIVKLPGSFWLAQTAGYIECVHPDGTATVLKDRMYDNDTSLPMSTEVLHMADHVFVDYWAGDSAGRSEVCARVKNGRIDCGKLFEHHPKG